MCNWRIGFSAWMGQLAMFAMFMAMWPAWHILPPPSPSLPNYADHFRQNGTGMLIGGIVMQFATAIFCIFLGGLVECLRKMEGKATPLTNSVLIIIPIGFAPLFLLACIFTEIGFRPDASDEMIRALADIGLFLLVFPAILGLVQFVVSGIIILGDVNPTPLFPRWTGYLNIWVGVLSLGGSLVGFFKTGPFAWSGIFAFWVPAVVFGILINVMFWAMRRAASHPALQSEPA